MAFSLLWSTHFLAMLCSFLILVFAMLYASKSVDTVHAIPSAEIVDSDLRLLFQNDLDCVFRLLF